jgi:CRISPR-associated protein Csb1
MLDLTTLNQNPRLLVKASLWPTLGERFQPTGFPDLGAAQYKLADGTSMLLVESAQSMANRAEQVCWDEDKNTLSPALAGLPYLHVDVHGAGGAVATTASVLEAHRINSPYVLKGELDKTPFESIFLNEVKHRGDSLPIDRKELVRAVFKYDPCSLLHGFFMSGVGDGRMRLARALSSFIEARDARVAQSGGVKNDRINASGDTSEGFGNVPFPRTEYTAAEITAYFSLDLRQLRSYGLPPEGEALLQLLALYKLHRVLRDGLRLRTACDLRLNEINVIEPVGFCVPGLAEVEAALPAAIKACGKLFASPPVTRLRFEQSDAAAQKSKKKKKAEAEADKAEVK